MKRLLTGIAMLCLAVTATATAAPLKVSALHPMMADLARQVGGDRIEVFDLTKGNNLHHFEPKPSDMATMRSSALVLASGKGLESYLDGLRASLGKVPVIEVGKTIPSLTVGKDAVYSSCPHNHGHSAGGLDPHWWLGISNMKRAARVISKELAAIDPAGKTTYQAGYKAYAKKLDDLKRWAKSELATIPSGQRKLVTSHNAFAYFAKEFGFEVIAIAGLSAEQNSTPQHLAHTITDIRDSGVRAVFPETNTSDKSLNAVAKQAGVTVAPPLIADGTKSGKAITFEAVVHHNVNTITRALTAQ
ncbi:MAG: metal ABC transporter substrate-binding protein [Verrucomicrobiales bacterium]|nr:metal ABC transporter substrate-binding protein [Verrucomicrobiota bacterium JB025]